MFFGLIILASIIIFVYLWGDYIKVLIMLEVVRLFIVVVLMWGLKVDFFSLNYFFRCLIFLVCESSVGFLLFVFFISIESELVKKINIVQF